MPDVIPAGGSTPPEAPATPPVATPEPSTPAAATPPSQSATATHPASEPQKDLTPEQIKEFQTIAENFEKNKTFYQSYEVFEKILGANPELKTAVEGAINEFVAKRSPGQTQPGQVNPGQSPQGAAPDPVAQLRGEINMKEYLSEFTRQAQIANIPKDDLNMVFNEVVNEVMAIEQNPLQNFNLGLVEYGLKKYNEKADRITRSRNTAYAAAKAQEVVPPSGSGGAPVKKGPEIMTAQERKDYMVNTLKAAFATN